MAAPQRLTKLFKGGVPEFNITIATIILALIIGFVNPKFWTMSNWFTILRWFTGLGLLALGESMALIGGGLDLSVSAVASIVSMVFAYLLEFMGFNVIAAAIVALLIAAAIGLYHGLFVIAFSPPLPTIVPAFIVTLGSLILVSGLAVVMTHGWPIVISKETAAVASLSSTPVLFTIILVGTIFIIFVQRYTVFGRFLYSIGGNMEAARVSGVPIHKTRVLAFVFSSVFSGLAGLVFTSMLMTGYPGVAAGQELYAIASNAIGGVSLAGGEGSAIGAIIGALLMTVIRNGLVLMGVSPYWHDPIAGIILVVAVGIDLFRRTRGAR